MSDILNIDFKINDVSYPRLGTNESDKIDRNSRIIDNVIEYYKDYINKSYNYFSSRFLNIRGDHRFEIKQEMIAKSAFWVTKKRYGQWIINDGGLEVEKLDVKGLDIVRSSFPPAFRDFMTKVLKAILAKSFLMFLVSRLRLRFRCRLSVRLCLRLSFS